MTAPGVIKLAVILAASGETSKVPFFIAGGLLAAWAVVLAVLGLRQAEFPRTQSASRGVMAISAVLVLTTASMAVATAGHPNKHGPGRSPENGAPAPAPAPGGASSGGGTKPAGSAAAASRISLAADPAGRLKFDQTKLTVKSGNVTIDFANQSQVPHNVTIEARGKTVAASRTITASRSSVSTALEPGSYSFYCSVDAHRQAGMQGTLTVS
jgi:plastocyanin